jgi:hypothetical protein
MQHDRLGRRRRPEQLQGLRPLHPRLPEEWESRALRVSMSATDWARFESLTYALAAAAPTQARAYGLALSTLMNTANLPVPEPGAADWMDWERLKTLRLLRYSS